MRLPCILTIAALLRASGQPRNATTAQVVRRLQGGGVTAVVITVHNALASTIDCLEALVATARGSVRLKVVLVLDNCDGPTTAPPQRGVDDGAGRMMSWCRRTIPPIR